MTSGEIMQFAKDSFYAALRDRLAAVNPTRTVSINGTVRPAVIVSENEPATASLPLANAFYLHWGAAQSAAGEAEAKRPLVALTCQITYGTSGSLDGAVDRGRVLGALDGELFAVCSPGRTNKFDFTQTPTVDLGSYVIWTKPQMKDVVTDRKSGLALLRTVEVTVFFFPEVDWL
jgi:hypothetical protein